MDRDIVISIKTVLLTFLFLSFGYVVYRLGAVIGILVLAFIIVISVEPFIKRVMKTTFLNKPVSRSLAVFVTYFLLLITLLGIVSLGMQPIIEQVRKLFSSLHALLSRYDIDTTIKSLDLSLSALIPDLPATSGGVFSALSSVFSNLALIFSLLIISIYMSLDWENIKRKFFDIFPGNTKEEVMEAAEEIELNIGHWVKGQLILMVVVGSLSVAGLLLLGIEYPLALGLVAGILEIVPMIGPLISAVLIGIVGFSSSTLQGIGAVVLFILIQQLENNVLVPKVMQKASGFSPLVILIALLVGTEFFGIIGAVLAIPMTMVLFVVLKRLLRHTA